MNWFNRKKGMEESLLKLKQSHQDQWDKLKHLDRRLDQILDSIRDQPEVNFDTKEMLPVNRYTLAESGALPGTQAEIIAGRSAEELQNGLNKFLKRNPGMDVVSTQLTAGPTALYAMVFYNTGFGIESINS